MLIKNEREQRKRMQRQADTNYTACQDWWGNGMLRELPTGKMCVFNFKHNIRRACSSGSVSCSALFCFNNLITRIVAGTTAPATSTYLDKQIQIFAQKTWSQTNTHGSHRKPAPLCWIVEGSVKTGSFQLIRHICLWQLSPQIQIHNSHSVKKELVPWWRQQLLILTAVQGTSQAPIRVIGTMSCCGKIITVILCLQHQVLV